MNKGGNSMKIMLNSEKKGKVLRKYAQLIITAILVCATLVGCGISDEAKEKVDGFNRAFIKTTTENDSYEAELVVSKNRANIFQALEKEYGAFLCDTWNFDMLDGKERYKYYQQIEGYPPELADRYMIVTPNYFKFNPVNTIDNQPITEYLIQETNVVNILVPQKYQGREDEIERLYKEYMYFNNVEVAEIYAEKIGTEEDTRTMDDFEVNIIYVNDEQSYFTYKPTIAEKSNNALNDCLVVILFENQLHPVQIAAKMTRGLFYPQNWNGSQIIEQDIRSTFAQYDEEASLNKTVPVLNLYEEYQQDKFEEYVAIGVIITGVVGIIFGIIFIILKLKKKQDLNHRN